MMVRVTVIRILQGEEKSGGPVLIDTDTYTDTYTALCALTAKKLRREVAQMQQEISNLETLYDCSTLLILFPSMMG